MQQTLADEGRTQSRQSVKRWTSLKCSSCSGQGSVDVHMAWKTARGAMSSPHWCRLKEQENPVTTEDISSLISMTIAQWASFQWTLVLATENWEKCHLLEREDSLCPSLANRIRCLTLQPLRRCKINHSEIPLHAYESNYNQNNLRQQVLVKVGRNF